ncbi:MAG: hypothetical protein NTX85_00735 [Candidatus Nomurabacteria bacterium]|nr:hypothetical protein [Candidatus Nomurabacteria bacterium]
MEKQKIYDHFTKGLDQEFRGWIGSEIETHFIDGNGKPITVDCSQQIFRVLVESGWKILKRKNSLITEIEKGGARILYELGRQNIEIATPPAEHNFLVEVIKLLLAELYAAACLCDAYPLFAPIMESDEDLLVIPDERDASWLELDGRENLTPLSTTSSVQFTLETKGPNNAISLLNDLADVRKHLLFSNPYVQDKIWRKYIQNSNAGYKKSRYGVVRPNSIEHYVDLLSVHDVVINGKLVPFPIAEQENIDLFLRSVWWNFRLRRYNDRLCIEVRTFSRRGDDQIFSDLLFFVMNHYCI